MLPSFYHIFNNRCIQKLIVFLPSCFVQYVKQKIDKLRNLKIRVLYRTFSYLNEHTYMNTLYCVDQMNHS